MWPSTFSAHFVNMERHLRPATKEHPWALYNRDLRQLSRPIKHIMKPTEVTACIEDIMVRFRRDCFIRVAISAILCLSAIFFVVTLGFYFRDHLKKYVASSEEQPYFPDHVITSSLPRYLLSYCSNCRSSFNPQPPQHLGSRMAGHKGDVAFHDR